MELNKFEALRGTLDKGGTYREFSSGALDLLEEYLKEEEGLEEEVEIIVDFSNEDNQKLYFEFCISDIETCMENIEEEDYKDNKDWTYKQEIKMWEAQIEEIQDIIKKYFKEA